VPRGAITGWTASAEALRLKWAAATASVAFGTLREETTVCWPSRPASWLNFSAASMSMLAVAAAPAPLWRASWSVSAAAAEAMDGGGEDERERARLEGRGHGVALSRRLSVSGSGRIIRCGSGPNPCGPCRSE
jgi:hypothetical protein